MTIPQGAGWSVADPQAEAEEKARARRKADALLSGDLDLLAQYQAEDEVVARGRENGGVYAVEHDSTHIYRHRDGRLQAGVNWVLGEELLDKIRQGYACLTCTEEFRENGLPTQWPETCPVCGYEVRRSQAEDFAKHRRGEVEVGENDAETEARWAWEKAENRWRRAGGKGILVPRGLNS